MVSGLNTPVAPSGKSPVTRVTLAFGFGPYEYYAKHVNIYHLYPFHTDIKRGQACRADDAAGISLKGDDWQYMMDQTAWCGQSNSTNYTWSKKS